MLFAGLRIGETVALDIDDVAISTRKGVVVGRSGKGDAYREVALNALVRVVLTECWMSARAASPTRRRRCSSARRAPVIAARG